MKVTPEIYAWLTKINIIKPFESVPEELVKNFQIPENIVSSLFLGKYMDSIIQPLQNEFNKFYNKDDNYVINLINLKQIPENKDYISYTISNKIRYENWKIIFGVLSHFGLIFTDSEISLLVNNDKEQLKKVITKIYEAYLKFSLMQKGNKTNYMKSKLSISMLNINDLDPDKEYIECNSLLEFMIISISKNMNLNPRQSVALLSNNRKYLKKICLHGYIFDFQMLKNWLKDIFDNKEIIINLIRNCDDGLNIFFETMGTVLYCKDLDISLQAALLLNFIKDKINMNWKWFYSEGINAFIFIFNKENSYYNKEFLKAFSDLISGKSSFFFDKIKKKFYDGEKKLVYDFLSNVINPAVEMEKDFSNNLQIFIYEICLSKISDISYNLSMLSNAFYNFLPTDENIVTKILSYYKYYVESYFSINYSTGILQMFHLMNRLGKIKNKYAPQIYKIIVELFLKTYDNIFKRELFLENFEKFFNENKDIPIDIFLEPYLNKLNSCHNYDLSDFLFLLKIVEHPRIEGKDISDIIKFILYVCLYSINYTRCANLILSLIFEKELITKNKNDEEPFKRYNLSQIENQFISFIYSALDIYISNIFKKDDKTILETPYEIMTQNFSQINLRIKNRIIKSVKKYRKLKECHSSGLLAMMWFYDDHDDIMMEIEEINRPIYEPIHKVLERKRIAKKERDDRSYTKKAIIYLNKLSQKKAELALKQQESYLKQKIKEQKIKQRLSAFRKFTKNIPQTESRLNPPLLIKDSRLTRNNSGNFEQSQKILSSQNFGYLPNIQNTNRLIRSQSHPEFNIMQVNDEKYLIKQYKIFLKSVENKRYRNKKTERDWIKKILIRKEDTVIFQELYNRYRIYFLQPEIFIKCLFLPFDLDEEEDRELKAIKGYNDKYKKNLLYYFKMYSNEAKQKITKIKFVKLLRDIGFDREKIEFGEINLIIKLMFRFNLSEFDFNQFINILIQLAYIIYRRFRPCLTIGEAYGNLIRKLVIKHINEHQIEYLYKKYQKVINYIFDLRSDKQPFNMPEGFKIVRKTDVKYNYRLATHISEYIGENRLICYQIIEEIIFDSCNSSLIEPYLEVDDYDDVEIEPEKVHNWSAGLTMAYMDLDKPLAFYGMFAADALEEGIRKMLKKNYEENNEGDTMGYIKKIFNIKWARDGVNKKRELRTKILIANERKKAKIEPENNKYIPHVNEAGYEKIKKEFRKVRERINIKKQKQKEENEAKEKLEIENEELKKEMMRPINREYNKKLKAQIQNIIEKKTGIRKERIEEEKKEANKLKRKVYIISDQDRQYNQFEKNINNSIKNKMKTEEIKFIIDKYINHLKVIYDIYSKIGMTKMNSKEGMHIDEFSQFLVNFTIMGVYISLEQMNWIFKNISLATQDKKNNKLFFTFDDFKLSICYLAIFSKLDNKGWKLQPKNIEELTENNIEDFFEKLGFKLPFDKIGLEKFINERRSMSTKNFINIQNSKKKEQKSINYNNQLAQMKSIKINAISHKNKNLNISQQKENNINKDEKEEKKDEEEKSSEKDDEENKNQETENKIEEKEKSEISNENKEEKTESKNESSDSSSEKQSETEDEKNNKKNNKNNDKDKIDNKSEDSEDGEDSEDSEDNNKKEEKEKEKKEDKKEDKKEEKKNEKKKEESGEDDDEEEEEEEDDE